jgi:2',3'-cyclic-nucleotide 2'-phosphodiesterase (5'-nucleotidase family)
MPRFIKLLVVCILPLTFLLSSCHQAGYQKTVEGSLVRVDSLVTEDPVMDSLIATYRVSLEQEMNEVIAYSAQLMRKGTPEDLLNNFIADLVLEKGKAVYEPADGQPIDFCVLNYGGLRTSIPEGPVTRARIYEVMPFENEMVVLTLSPGNTREVFEYIASRSTGTPIAGLRVGITNRRPVDIRIGGEPFDPERNYKVLTSDYLASAGDNMSFFMEPVNSEVLGMRIRDAIILHLQEHQARQEMISSGLDGRIYYLD